METGLIAVSATYNYQRTEPYCIRDLSFSIAEQGVTAVLGESGSGKTSILRLLAGFLRPSCGKVIINGREVASSKLFIPPEERSVGVLFQDYALFPHLNVTENILFGVSKKINKAQRKQILDELLAACKLDTLDLTSRRPHELSGGQMQRVALARVLASQPRLLILDEPFNSVDLELREQMLSHIKELVRSYQMRMLYITHDRNEAFSIAEHLAIIRQGQLLQQGSARELYEKPLNSYVAKYLDKANILPLRSGPQQDIWQSPVGPIPNISDKKVEVSTLRFCLRPHQLIFCSQSEVERCGQVSVVEQRYYGSYSEVYCVSTQFAGVSLIVLSDTQTAYTPGEILYVRPLMVPGELFHFLQIN